MYRLTKPQKSIYNMEKFTGGAVAVICSSMLRKGAIDADKLKSAVNTLYRINDALRIRITETADGTKQTVSDYAEQDFETLKFASEDEFLQFAANYAKQPIDLYGSLCDVKIIFTENKYGLLVKLHHMIGDAWTMSLLAKQFSAILDGNVPEAFSYTDYIQSETEYVQSHRYEKDKTFFVEQFKKCDDVTYLSDKQSNEYAAARKTIKLTSDQTAKINAMARDNDSSIFAVFMTLFAAYFSRIKMNAEKFYIGTPVLNRTGIKEQNTAGMFINTVPFLAEIENEKTFTENLQTSTDSIMSLLRHQYYNYEDFLSELRREYSFTEKLYDVILSYQNAKTEAKDFQSEWHSCGMQTESLQIHIDDRDSEGVLTINYDYRTNIFTENEIERMHEHLFNLFADAVTNLDKKIYELDILSNDEKNTLLYEFNDTKADYPKDKCVHQLFEEQAERTPDKTAVIACDKTLTYDELNRLSNRIANALIEKGIGKGDIVAFALPRRSYLIAVMFGILKSGAAYMPIDPDYPQDRIDYMLSDSQARLFITNNVLDNLLENANTKNPNIKIRKEDIYCALHTSGSTGTPKLASLTHKNIVSFMAAHTDFFENVKLTVSATIITFDAFIMESVVSIIKGISLRLMSEDEIYNQYEFKNVFNGYSNIMFFATPTKMKTYIENSKTKDFMRNICSFVIGGEIFTEELYCLIKDNAVDCNIFNIYGPTETTICTLVDKLNNNNITLGKPTLNTRIYIVDKYNNIVPVRQIGELCIAGDGVGAGYLNRPELTAEKFIDNPFGEGKMYKTGDLAYWREDGNIMFVGRNDFQVKIRGLRIELGEIENAICSVDGISQAVVVVRKDESGRQLICAFYTEKTAVDVADIKKIILDRLPKYMLPHIFTCLDEMPLTPSGKINHKALPDVDLESISNDTEYVKPQTELQREIARLMEQVLKYSPIGLNDDFFDCGGDSLMAIEFVSKAHNEGIYFNLQAIFDNPTVKELCEHIENGDKAVVQYDEAEFAGINSILLKNTIDRISEPKVVPVGNVLLAGATGYLGIHILSDFLDNDSGIAYCLVRGEYREKSEIRLKELLQFYFEDKYSDLFDTRIKVLCADLTNDNLGLNSEDYTDLTRNVSTVINAAASVKHYGSYKYFYETNVETVKKLIDFCFKSNAKLIHTSTLSVSGNSFGDEFDGYISETEKHFYESSLYIGQPLENVYARSKFEAEKEVLSAMANGLKANIMRMGNLTNRFSDGKFQRNYESNTFLKHVKAMLELGSFPDYLLPLYAEFTPIDNAANAVMTIARHFSEEQTVFHINSTKVVYFDKLLKYFDDLNISMEIVDSMTFTKLLRNIAKQASTKYIFETFINDMDENEHLNYDSNIRIENDFTVEYLKNLGFEWSDIGIEYLRKYINYFREIEYLGV